MGYGIEFKGTKDSKQNKNKRIPSFSRVTGLNWLDLVIYLWIGSFFFLKYFVSLFWRFNNFLSFSVSANRPESRGEKIRFGGKGKWEGEGMGREWGKVRSRV